MKIGDVARLKVGEWVMAIGSPFGLENTVTAGIVSAKQRDTGDFLPFIQTDVAINPGNSGGPLINLRGEVVGINSQIYSRSGGFMGISFAIPIDEAMRVADQLRSSGRVIRGRIGVTIAPVTKEVAESIGLGKPHRALVQGVEIRRPGREGRRGGGRHHRQGRRQDGGEVGRPAAHHRQHQAGQRRRPRCRSSAAAAYKDLSVTVVRVRGREAGGQAAKRRGAAGSAHQPRPRWA